MHGANGRTCGNHRQTAQNHQQIQFHQHRQLGQQGEELAAGIKEAFHLASPAVFSRSRSSFRFRKYRQVSMLTMMKFRMYRYSTTSLL